jgi:hypothetical protein
MIGPNAYDANFYALASPLAGQKAAVDDAADFARILNQTAPEKSAAAPQETGGNSFIDFVKGVADVVNPLQHIPVIGAIYRHMTGDEINPLARLAGDTLYGGPIGAAFAAADIACQKTTGRDMGETMIAALTPDKNTMVAQNLNDRILPAAGDAGPDGIIWSTPANSNELATNSRLPLAPPLPRSTGANGIEPAPQSAPTPAPPAFQEKDTVATSQSPPTASQVDSTTVLPPHEAPAAASRTDVPPALIAAKMMEALDKYQQMKSTGMAPAVSGEY